MNALLVLGLLLVNSSCTYYNPLDRNGSPEESESYHLEMDYYQLSLEAEDRQLRNEMLMIMEAMEDGKTEGKGRYEEIQERRSIIPDNLAWNESLRARGPIIGGGPFPPRCDERPDLLPCPIAIEALENFYLTNEQWQKSGDSGAIECFDEKGNLVGKMVGTTDVVESDGFFLKAEMEYEADRVYEIRIRNLDVYGDLRTSVFRVER